MPAYFLIWLAGDWAQ